MTFSLVCAEAMTSKEAALVLDCGDEAQQVQERKNEGAKNLPAGTAVLKAPALTARSAGHLVFKRFQIFHITHANKSPRDFQVALLRRI